MVVEDGGRTYFETAADESNLLVLRTACSRGILESATAPALSEPMHIAAVIM